MEHIHFVDSGYGDDSRRNPEIIKYVSKSIGKLSSRPTLRSLFIKNDGMANKVEAEGVNDEFLDLFDCPNQKSNLENLSLLIRCLKLSTIGQFINGNLNLKKLSLDQLLWIDQNAMYTLKQELLEILACNHGIEELKFVKQPHTCSLDEKWIDRTIFRNEFPELLSHLETRASSICEKNKKTLKNKKRIRDS